MTSVPSAEERVDALLESRRKLLGVIDAERHRWRATSAGIEELGDKLARLRDHPDASEQLKAVLTGAGLRALQARISELLDLQGHAAARFSRTTVNLGVSGQARVGKSTLLQSLSGLTADQIPSGSGIPVTAVRSRIYHSPGPARATVRLHTVGSFLDESVRPYHAQLGLTSAPATLEEFASWRYPEEVEDSRMPLLQRVKAAQQGLWSFRQDLVGGEREVALDQLRAYVAYPTQADVDSGRPARRYLAVREARIECPFPHAGVGRLGIADLPGLGEIAAEAERQHVAGLRHDVDAVLLVKRPLEGMAYFGAADARALALLDEARGLVRRTGDFVFIVVNRGKGEPESLAAALHGHLTSEVNAGMPGRHFTVLEADAADPASVGEHLLAPLLAALAERLPVMDGDIIAGLTERAEAVERSVLAEIATLEAALAALRGHTAAPAEDLEARTKALREDIAADLAEIVAGLRSEAAAEHEDTDFVAAVQTAYEELRGWIARGLGTAYGNGAPEAAPDAGSLREQWCAEQLKAMRVHRNAAPVASAELNRIRVEIGRRFSSVDAYFEQRVRQLHHGVAQALSRHTGLLVSDDGASDGPAPPVDGNAWLTRLRGLLDAGFEPCPALSAAIGELLSVRLDYRTQLHPRIRAELNGLNLEVRDPATGQMRSQIAVEVSPGGVEELYDFIALRAEQAAYRTCTALLRDSVVPALVLYAAVEQFEDTLIRSGAAEREYRRLARTYRNELWPGRYQGLGSEHARFAAVTRACRDVERAVRGTAPGHEMGETG
ncbi:hypothetical protein [Streptomyces sp. 8N706]|uniref:hypothetical protein n=1 Tax=Streptomyces sp. 8N706 TaxID=3457416 RepID=UPI003FCF7899